MVSVRLLGISLSLSKLQKRNACEVMNCSTFYQKKIVQETISHWNHPRVVPKIKGQNVGPGMGPLLGQQVTEAQAHSKRIMPLEKLVVLCRHSSKSPLWTCPCWRRPCLSLNFFFHRSWETIPRSPPAETYYWPNEFHVTIPNQSPARNRTLWLTEINQGSEQGLQVGGQLPKAAWGYLKAELRVVMGRGSVR